MLGVIKLPAAVSDKPFVVRHPCALYVPFNVLEFSPQILLNRRHIPTAAYRPL